MQITARSRVEQIFNSSRNCSFDRFAVIPDTNVLLRYRQLADDAKVHIPDIVKDELEQLLYKHSCPNGAERYKKAKKRQALIPSEKIIGWRTSNYEDIGNVIASVRQTYKEFEKNAPADLLEQRISIMGPIISSNSPDFKLLALHEMDYFRILAYEAARWVRQEQRYYNDKPSPTPIECDTEIAACAFYFAYKQQKDVTVLSWDTDTKGKNCPGARYGGIIDKMKMIMHYRMVAIEDRAADRGESTFEEKIEKHLLESARFVDVTSARRNLYNRFGAPDESFRRWYH